jgi:beta-glucanase (GH16 family)
MAHLSKVLLLAWLGIALSGTARSEVLWSDEFDSGTALDSAVWSYDLGAWGWGNQELQEYTNNSDNVRIENGNLVINVREDGGHFTSARVRTQDKLMFKYGSIEARIKVPDLADGLWPAFWTLGNDFGQVGWPHCGELDIMEMGSSGAQAAGVINRRVGSAAHWENWDSKASYARYFDNATDLTDGFHLFRMDWTPTRIKTYIDNQLIWNFHIEEGFCADCTEFHQPHFIILNVAVGGTYTGLMSSGQITATTPAEMLIDYVRISDNGFTELSGSSVPEEPVVGQEYSGSWYNDGQSGHGFSMEFGKADDGSPLAVVYWYTWDDKGNPIFLVGNGVQNENEVDIVFESPVGMNYGEFNPQDVERKDGGSARFEFSDSDNATFSYTPSEFTTQNWGHTAIESLAIEKLFAVPLTETGEPAE